MEISDRALQVSTSITLALNAKAQALSEEGKKIFNLTAGQLPFRPAPEFVSLIRSESDFVKSFQYSPAGGYPELRKKVLQHFEQTRAVNLKDAKVDFDCVISNGAKHSLTNILGCLLNPDDEAILLAPYWISYPEMIKFCRAKAVVVESSPFEMFTPAVSAIKEKINAKTKVIILNSPNNPAGLHYSEKWMKEFGEMLLDYPDLVIVSDEIYYQLNYYDPRPSYFYQFFPEHLSRTVIVEGISKVLACTGLRVGYTLAPKKLTDAIAKLQGQTTSGANSLVQRALISFDFNLIPPYLDPIKKHLRENAETLGNLLRDHKFSHIWYQPMSAFYYLMDFSQLPVIDRYRKNADDGEDYSFKICEDLLEQTGVAIVPGGPFGCPNTARISLVSEKQVFITAITHLLNFLLSRD